MVAPSGEGCCFEIGFGATEFIDGEWRAAPILYSAREHVELSSCSVGQLEGGSTGYRLGNWPESAEEAHQAILEGAAEH
jgi:hypothetical protein